MLWRDVTERKRDEAERERLLAKVQRQAAELEATFESAPDGLSMFDSSGELLRMNSAARRILGLTEDYFPETFERLVELSRRPASDGQPLAPDQTVYARALRGETVRDEEVRLEHPGGTVQWLSLSGAPIHVGGERIGAIVIDSDITEQRRFEKALRDSEARFRALAEALPQIVWTADAEGGVEWLNQRWYDYTGQAGFGDGWKPLIHPEDIPRKLERWERARRTGTIYENEFRFRRRDGEYRWFLARAWPVRDGEGYAQPEDRQHAKEAGFDAHLSKPSSLDALLASLSSEH